MPKTKSETGISDINLARLQGWVVSLVQLVADAYDAGMVLGAGARIATPQGDLRPDVLLLLLPPAQREQVRPQPALGVQVLPMQPSKIERAQLCQRYADANLLELWLIYADSGHANLYQRNAEGGFDDIPPDQQGLHFSSVITELVFPVDWFKERPGLWQMMEWWGMIERDDGSES